MAIDGKLAVMATLGIGSSMGEDEAFMEQGERVRMYRLFRRKTQQELSVATGLPITTISKIENGRKQLWLVEATRIAGALNIRLEDLAGAPLPPVAPFAALISRYDTFRGLVTALKREADILGEELEPLKALVASADGHIDPSRESKKDTQSEKNYSGLFSFSDDIHSDYACAMVG